MPTAEEADLMHLPAGTPVGQHARVGIDEKGRRVRVLFQIWAGDRQVITYGFDVPERRLPPMEMADEHLYLTEFALAGEEDVESVLSLRRYAEEWLRVAGIEQWTASAYGARVVEGWIGAGSTFVGSSSLTGQRFWSGCAPA